MRVFKALAIVLTFALGACVQATAPRPADPNVVQVTGWGKVRFGASRAELAGQLDTEQTGCHAQLRDRPESSLVFTPDGKLVLLWFDSPLRSAAGIATGDTLVAAAQAYPKAAKLTAPAASHRFDGLLVVDGEHGYLFLHDGKTVQKAIAGYADYLRQLFNTGFGVC